LLAHARGSSPAAAYERTRLTLPPGVDTRRAIASLLNSFRAELSVPPVEYGLAQSEAIEFTYAELFDLEASWVMESAPPTRPQKDSDRYDRLHRLMERGDRIEGVGPVCDGWTNDDIAFDGDASDWLVGRLLDPPSR